METCAYLLIILDAVLLVALMHAEERDNLERERAHERMREQIVRGQGENDPQA
jgi:hypothetical protein